jgi:hypothetical protein
MQILGGVGVAGPTYTYHVFTSSGTLTVTSGGDMSLLAVGGGGGGGYNQSGGGGGGELDNVAWTALRFQLRLIKPSLSVLLVLVAVALRVV